jgi:membrane-associated phospholipid phosphatase
VPAEEARQGADHRERVALAAAGACVLGLIAVWAFALRTAAGRARDDALLHGLVGLARGRIYGQLTDVALWADPVPYAIAGLLCIGVALARRRVARAVAVAVVLAATGATTQVLKHLLAQPRPVDWLGGRQVEGLSWPSGHGTAAMTLALCAVVVAPPAWRPAVGLAGWAYAVGLAYATLALVWHYPSDLYAGFLVAGLWVSLALATVARLEAGAPEPGDPPALAWLVTLGTAGALAAAVLAGVGSEPVPLGTADRATVVIGALTLAALALTLVVTTIVAASPQAAARDAARRRSGRGRSRARSRQARSRPSG